MIFLLYFFSYDCVMFRRFASRSLLFDTHNPSREKALNLYLHLLLKSFSCYLEFLRENKENCLKFESFQMVLESGILVNSIRDTGRLDCSKLFYLTQLQIKREENFLLCLCVCVCVFLQFAIVSNKKCVKWKRHCTFQQIAPKFFG